MDSAYSLAYGEIENVQANVDSKVVDEQWRTSLYVTSIICSGSIYGEYCVKVGDKKVSTKRSGPSRNVEFSWENFPLFVEKDETLKVYVKHYRLDVSAKFECGIFGYN